MFNSLKTYFKSNWPNPLLSFFLVFILGFGVGIISSTSASLQGANPGNKYSIRLVDPNNKLISPLLIADSGTPGNKRVEDKLKLETFDLLNISEMQTVSIYYRDAKTGTWAGVGENTAYDPGSLLKVPIMIAWFRKAQDDPSVMSQKLLFSGSISNSGGNEFSGLTAGNWYTIEHLIDSMITKSDNDAKDVLLANLEPTTINSVFSDLGIQTWGDTQGKSKHISPVIYSRFLRILYNSTYLNHELSEKALELLSSTNFDDGLRAGVPSKINVAHKFGQYQDLNRYNAPIELHDCGIIYHPEHPYLLCVMTRGTSKADLNDLKKVIQEVSKTVYHMVNSNEIGLPKN